MIIKAISENDIDLARNLFIEYGNYLNLNLDFQNFDDELSSLPGKYAEPEGTILLYIHEGRPAGCAALRKIGDGIAEMKRLYVRPVYRGLKIGYKLCEALIKDAKDRNYSKIRLDTLKSLNEAMTLYQSLGFYKIKPYYENPLPDVIYWEKKLI